MPYKIGVTGGIGAGKSTVCRIFQILGAPVYDADSRAKWLMNHDSTLISSLKDLVGNEIYTPEGLLNRSFLSDAIFSNPEMLKKVNALVHPEVGADFRNWLSSQTSPYVVKEAALLFESGSYRELDTVITVTAPLEIRIARVLKRDEQRSMQQVIDIIDKQWIDQQKIELSEFELSNNDEQLLTPQVVQLHEIFLQRALKQ